MVEAGRLVSTANEAMVQQLRLPYSPEELVGMDFAEIILLSAPLFPGQDYAQRIEALVAVGREVVGERLERSDGVVLLRDYWPIRGSKGVVAHFWKQVEANAPSAILRQVTHDPERSQAIVGGDLVFEEPQPLKLVCGLTEDPFEVLPGETYWRIEVAGEQMVIRVHPAVIESGSLVDLLPVKVKQLREEATFFHGAAEAVEAFTRQLLRNR